MRKKIQEHRYRTSNTPDNIEQNKHLCMMAPSSSAGSTVSTMRMSLRIPVCLVLQIMVASRNSVCAFVNSPRSQSKCPSTTPIDFSAKTQPRRHNTLLRLNDSNVHEYTLEPDSNPEIPPSCRFTEEQIHVLIAKRLQCKKRHSFDDADKILQGLNLNGIYLQDHARKYRVDGENHFGRRSRYVQRGGSYGLAEGDIAIISELVEERARQKRTKEFHKSDELTERLKSKYKVKVNDKKREWSVVVSNWDGDKTNGDGGGKGGVEEYYVPTPLAPKDHATHTMSDDTKELIRSKLQERTMARRNKEYRKADRIRDALMEEYSIFIDDLAKEWKVVDDVHNADNDPFLMEAQLSQRSAFVRREGEEDRDTNFRRNDVDSNVGNVNYSNDEEPEANTKTAVDKAFSQIFSTSEDDYENENEIEEDEDDEIDEIETATSAVAAEAPAEPSTESDPLELELGTLTVVALKDKLRDAGLPVSGKKAELIERLLQQ